MKIKSMRDIPTVQGLARARKATSREQMVNDLARLEHEKARLERELAVWEGNRSRTAERLRQVEERLAATQQSLDPTPPTAAPARSASTEWEAEREVQGGWQSFTLEY